MMLAHEGIAEGHLPGRVPRTSQRLASVLIMLALAVGISSILCPPVAAFVPLNNSVEHPDMSWTLDYGSWRHRRPVGLVDWSRRIEKPVPQAVPVDKLRHMDKSAIDKQFESCITKQSMRLSSRVAEYRSPRLQDVRGAVNRVLSAQNLKVAVSVFWGRGRYVRLLWPYLERNLRSNMGIIDEIILITKSRDSGEGEEEARRILENGVKQYPGVVREEPFCKGAYGCAFDKILTDRNTVYIKLDDDIVFIKDGSVEHLVYQTLTNKDYTFFSGSVVNNPHGFALHGYVGAYPPTTFHWRDMGTLQEAPYIPKDKRHKMYWGPNVYPAHGSKAHEAFIFNVARNRLDMYTFDLWNLNECQCGTPQPAMEYCDVGYYRWSINAIAWTYNVSSQYPVPVPKFDEPAVSEGWAARIAPHRAAVVGESLFVHLQYTRQRSSNPKFGLREDVLLPWYEQLMQQYTAQEYDSWRGNSTLLSEYHRLALQFGEFWYTHSRATCGDDEDCKARARSRKQQQERRRSVTDSGEASS